MPNLADPSANAKQTAQPESGFSAVQVSLFFGAMAIVEYFFHFRKLNHLFETDTTYWLYNRATSWPDFLGGFITRDISGWYRPLGNRLIPFLFYDWFGTEPAGYRVVIAVLLFIDFATVYVLLAILTRRRTVAYAGTFFFGIHTVNAIVACDAAFAPELLYAFFFLTSVILYWLHYHRRRGSILFASCVSFVFGLWSKESAVALPFVLVVVGSLTLEKGSIWRRSLASLHSARWHFLILTAYLVFAIGYLHVAGINFNSLLQPPPPPGMAGYRPVLGASVLVNADYALTWASNIPRGWTSQWQKTPKAYIVFLKAFRLAIGILSVVLLFNSRRRWILLGILWFYVSSGPALLIRDHFLSYYLFLPLAGISLVVGTAVDGFFHYLKHSSRRLRIAGIGLSVITAAMLLFVCHTIIQRDQRSASWFGNSLGRAIDSILELRKQIPNLKPNTTIYIINDEDPRLDANYENGRLFGFFYKDKTLRVLYSSRGDALPPGCCESLLLLRYKNGHLQKEPLSLDSGRFKLLRFSGRFAKGFCALQMNATEFKAGDTIIITIPGHHPTNTEFYYRLNNGPLKEDSAQCDLQGRVRYIVSSDTTKGRYHILAFKTSDGPDIYMTDEVVTIR